MVLLSALELTPRVVLAAHGLRQMARRWARRRDPAIGAGRGGGRGEDVLTDAFPEAAQELASSRLWTVPGLHLACDAAPPRVPCPDVRATPPRRSACACARSNSPWTSSGAPRRPASRPVCPAGDLYRGDGTRGRGAGPPF
ncbi:hypothetical protein QJS66_22775 [Kocuria rhizophila]|nr:hypothetical protein QJS66_22775 [Kocuria rhizophila]